MRDPASDLWSIYWFDPRYPKLSAPMVGAFEGREGRFYSDDNLAGRPIRVRFVWRLIDIDHLSWEQAFSADAGETWEINWTMAFVRTV